MPGAVACELSSGVARVRLSRPEKLNGLTLGMLADLAATAHRLRADRGLRAVVLSGEGRSFCAGLDFAAVLGDRAGTARAFAVRPWWGTNLFQEACWAWRRVPVPVVAVVHGHCLGAGLQLALGADVRVTTPGATWSVLEGRWGLVPDMAGARTLAEQVGKDTAKRLATTGEMLTGARAHALGLATEVAEDPAAVADDLVAQVLTRSPDAVAATKRLFEDTWGRSPRRTFARERAEQLRLLLGRNAALARRAARGEPVGAAGPGGVPGYRPRARRYGH